ncbi:MAG: TRAP transporter large permease subunit [Pseudomonadales bacterium]|nr:TRAP transporter large permease subunit [Pseudomonadales bacterium]
MQTNDYNNISLFEKALTFLALGLLLITILVVSAESLHSQLIKLGVKIWPNYTFVRTQVIKPDCDYHFDTDTDIEKTLDELEIAAKKENEESLFDEGFDRAAVLISLTGQNILCKELHKRANFYKESSTPSLLAFSVIEKSTANFASLALKAPKIILALLLVASIIITTLRRHHIAFRPVTTFADHRISTLFQLIANAVMCVSFILFIKQAWSSGIETPHAEVMYILLLGFFVLTLINLFQLLKSPDNIDGSLAVGDNVVYAFLSIPLYAYMILMGAMYFIFIARYTSGMSLHFSSMFELSGMFIQISLFLWVGMLLKQTQIGERVFSLLTPWNLPPELLCVVAVLLLAIPTAYTGGSGILVLAMGAFIYEELRKVGTRRQFALATAAMTGSSGIVLKPCILIMMIAIINKEVVSSELYQEGYNVFMVSLLVFFLFAFFTKQQPLALSPPGKALKSSLIAAKPLLAYIVVIAFIVLVFGFVLDMWVNEFTAAILLPFIIIAVIVLERRWGDKINQSGISPKSERSIVAIQTAISDSVVHIGALLIFVGANMVLGGVVQRSSGEFELLSFSFYSPLQCMVVLAICLVFIGMIMESMSGILFVTATLAPLAYESGINPIHFWMTTLVALELGFLTPPIALNHLYVRQVVGEKEAALAAAEGHNFWYRHERILLPIAVMSTVLILVAIGPFVTGYGGWY